MGVLLLAKLIVEQKSLLTDEYTELINKNYILSMLFLFSGLL